MKNKILGIFTSIISMSFVAAGDWGMMDSSGYGMMGYGMSFFAGIVYLLVVVNLGFLAIYLYEKIWGKGK